MYQTILVPVDGSDFSAHALPVAVELARRSGATLHLALVHDPSAYIPFVPGEVAVPVYDAALVSAQREADQTRLNRAVASLKDSGVRIVSKFLEGTVVESLVEYGQQVAAELTVMTTHGRSGFARLRLGSVASAYLTRATAPVLLVYGAGRQPEDLTAPSLPTGTLLCALDGSPFSENILPHAAGFADACGMRMALVSVVSPHAVAMAPFATEALLADPAVLDQEEHDRVAYLERTAKSCPPGTTARGVTDMSVANAILEEAKRIDAGAIAVATHGRGGFKRLMLGSIADELIRHSVLPILVYRPDPSK